jgi:hypothetical protein
MWALQAIRKTRPPGGRARAQMVSSFGEWADEVWAEARVDHAWCALRDRKGLDGLHAGPDRLKLQVELSGETVGWAVVRVREFVDHLHFGSLKVGVIADNLAPASRARHVVQAASDVLEQLGVDLIVTNQAHPSWCSALARSGFLRGPSNYLFAASPAARAPGGGLIHVNRGDGDGLVNL